MNVELAREVQRRILAEPNHVNMEFWQTKYSPCGTACCIAGHTVLAAGECCVGRNTADVAQELLDLSRHEAELIFFFMIETPRDSPYIDLCFNLRGKIEGTPEYAAVVAEAIERCIERNSPPEVKVPEEVEELVYA